MSKENNVHFKVTEEQRLAIEQSASDVGVGVSAFVRHHALAESGKMHVLEAEMAEFKQPSFFIWTDTSRYWVTAESEKDVRANFVLPILRIEPSFDIAVEKPGFHIISDGQRVPK